MVRLEGFFFLPFYLLFSIFLVSSALAGDDKALASLDLAELMDVEVVTASRRAEPLSQIAGAVTVLNEEDIFRSGAATFPEVLKLVPGVHVVQVDTDKWAVGIRGFNGLLSNKQLVMIDGRPITSPAVAGVFWGSYDIPLSTVKRIEVVRGTWTSLWGGDSFTGVINIITKSASETQGGQSVTIAGTTGIDQTVRKGGTIGDNGHYRVYTKASYKGGSSSSLNPDGRSSRDWLQGRVGFRADWNNAFTDELSFQGDVGRSRINDGAKGTQQIYVPRPKNDFIGYGQLSWERATGLDAGIRYRTSYTREKESIGDMDATISACDMELQYAAEQIGSHLLTYGVGGKYFWDEFADGSHVTMGKKNSYNFNSNAFVQDKITLSPESLYLIFGAKFDYFGSGTLEIQPTMRLLHTRINEEYWLAVSRAVRAESRWQRGGSYSIDHRGKIYTVNAPADLTSEKMISYEAGYRREFSENMQFDVSLYINDYDQLTNLEFDGATHTATLTNTLKGTACGTEVLLDWVATDWLTFRPSASVIFQDIHGPESNPVGDSMPKPGTEGELKLQVMTTPAENVGFDVFMAYAGSMSQHKGPDFFTFDAHASWRVDSDVMLELIGRSLSNPNEEFSSIRMGPSVDLRVTWDF
jgi:iron complex outermembrane receptor protein